MKHCLGMNRRRFVEAIALASLSVTTLIFPATASAAEMTVYKSPSCGCCTKWVNYLETNGFDVEVRDLDELASVKSRLGVPRHLQSCHTAEIEGYVVEGHVPAEDIRRLLVERPTATGIAVPGMPIGSPGMEYGERKDPYNVILFGDDDETIFTSH